MTSTLGLSAASKPKRAREEDSESESELSPAQDPASQLPRKRIKLLIPPSVLADRLSSLNIMGEAHAAATTTDPAPREELSDSFLPSCGNPSSDTDNPVISDDVFDDLWRAIVPTSVEVSTADPKFQRADALEGDLEAYISDLIPIHEDPADVQAHATITRDAENLSLSVLVQKYPKIFSGDTVCVHTTSKTFYAIWEDEATCLDCLAHMHDDHRQDMDNMAYELEEEWSGLKESGHEESDPSESESDQEVGDRDDDTLAREKKEWQEWQELQENENDADEKTMKLWLSEHAVDFAEGEHWEQWLEEPRNGMVPAVRYMLGVGLDENLFVDEVDYQDTREPPPTAKSTCLNCLAETFTHEMHEGECKPRAILRQQRKIREDTDRKSEQMRREYGFDETTWYGEVDEDDMNDI